MGADYWRDEPDWPLPGTEYREYFLHSGGNANTADGDGTLSTKPPRDEPEDSYEYDPQTPAPTVGGTTFLPGLHVAANAGPRDQHRVESRRDVLCFTSSPLDTPLEATGMVSVVLSISSTAPDADFVATLADVTPGGVSTNVTSGIARARYRSSRDAPSLLEPGRTYEIAVDLGGCSHVFRRGHCIRLQVTSGSFPRFERNPQNGGLPAEETQLETALHRVYHDAGRASRLVLPVVERDETLERLA
jgi:putative CocE/NonD family hydrolase